MNIKATSANGTIEFLGNGVVIKTKGTTKTIPLERVQGVEFKKSGLTAGRIRVIVAGDEKPTMGAFGKVRNRTQQSLVDTSTVTFSRPSKNREFEAVADAINAALLQR